MNDILSLRSIIPANEACSTHQKLKIPNNTNLCMFVLSVLRFLLQIVP